MIGLYDKAEKFAFLPFFINYKIILIFVMYMYILETDYLRSHDNKARSF